MEQRHIIKRQIIELTVPDAAAAPALQDEISRVYRQRIIPLIDRCCGELGQPDRVYRINSLELDLGVLDGRDLEAQFVAKTDTALRAALAAQIDRQEQAVLQTERSPKTQSALELFAFFVQTGSLPWWADASQPGLLSENLAGLLRETPRELGRLLQTLAREERARRRMANQYGDEQLAQLCGLLLPAYQPSFAQDAQALIAGLQKTKTAAAWPPSRLRQSAWNNLLQVAALGGQQYPSLTAFYRAVLERVAADLAVTGADFVNEFQQVWQDGKAGDRPFKDMFASAVPARSNRNADLTRRLAQLQAASDGPLAEAWAGLRALAPRLADPLRAQCLAALGKDGSPQAAAGRILGRLQSGHDAARPSQELSRLAGMFQSALGDGAGEPGDELAARLGRHASAGGPSSAAWAALRATSTRFAPGERADWLAALDSLESENNNEGLTRLLESDPARRSLSAQELSRLAGMLQPAPGGLRDELDARLGRYQSEGGALVGAWAMLRAISARFAPGERADWLAALDGLGSQASDEGLTRLLETELVRRSLSAQELSSLAGMLQPAPGDLRDKLAVILGRHASAGGPSSAAWVALQAMSARFTPGERAAWLAALDGLGSEVSNEDLARLLETSLAQRSLSAQELSSLTGMLQPAPGDLHDELAVILGRRQSEGGALAEAWAALRAISARFAPGERADWLAALDGLGSEVSNESLARLLESDLARRSLSAQELSGLAEMLQPAPAGVRDELDALLGRYQSEGGALTEAWAALRAISTRFATRERAEWLAALDGLGSKVSNEDLARLLETDLARRSLSEQELSRLAQLLQPAPGDIRDELDALLERHQSEGGALAEAWAALRAISARFAPQERADWLAALEAPGNETSARAAESLLRFLNAGAARRDLRADERAGLLRAQAALRAAAGPGSAVDEALPDLRFSDAGELSVANAGLVILWPFLANFFKHVGLLEDKQFKDPAAGQRGVGLLQVIATQEAAPPEYLLPLNKLLCGLEPQALFDFGYPLRKSETRECAKLLKAVIAQAPILHNMSADGFRGSFLLRAGLLSRRDGLWLLRVERQTYDIVLERFPWNWEWVKLPWMERPLRVEW